LSDIITGIIRRLEKLERVSRRLGARDALQVTSDPILRLTGLRGYWPMSSFDENGDAYDLSGQGRTLTHIDTVRYGYDGLVPWGENFAGEGCDYLRRVDEAGLSITGGETYVDTDFQGLSLGGWFHADSVAGTQGLITKWETAEQSYALYLDGANVVFAISSDCAAEETVTSTVTCVIGDWFFAAGRFVPDTEIGVCCNATWVTTATATTTICDGDAELAISAFGTGIDCFDGRYSHCWLCAAALSDECIHAIFQQQRSLFGV